MPKAAIHLTPSAVTFPSIAGRLLLGAALLTATIQSVDGADSSVTFEAESGQLGSDLAQETAGEVHYIHPSTDRINPGNPGSPSRVGTYTVTFPAPAVYELYARMRVGPDAPNDDSLFYGNSFGAKSPVSDADWVTVNGLGAAGFTDGSSIVTGGGQAGANVWKWVNLSQFTGRNGFPVSSTNLTQSFQIGAREDGLQIDKFVFGMAGVQYTVANLDSAADGFLPPASAQLNWNDLRQQIDGFGGGVVFLNDGSMLNNANADTLFKMDAPNRLGLTLLRVRVEPNNNWSNSVGAWNGSVNEAKLARARGAGVLASPWTPPAGLKTTTNIVGGSLKLEHYRSYGRYLEKYASNMLANGVPLSAISIQNEPDWDPDYEGCVWTGTQLRNFFHTNAGVIKSAPVMMPESLGFNFALSDPSLNDPIAVTNIALIGGHLYGFPNIVPYSNALNKGKRVWQTEYLVNDQTMETSIQTAKQIHDCLTGGRMSAYIWWKCLGNVNGLLSASGVVQRRGYVMAQFSRFVRPGHVRIGESNSGSGAVSAYRNITNNQFTIIAINTYGLPLQQNFQLTNFPAAVMLKPWITSASQSLTALSEFSVTNGSFHYTLPPNSIVSFAGAAPIVQPLISDIEISGTELILKGANGNAPGTEFHTLTSTNLETPLKSWTILSTNQLGHGGTFRVTNIFDASETARFFLMRLP
ncbi:MAG TPA: hypothetical protein VEH04_17400 [Verrucomicrobiae bacterium]|nr:hypothetical protein [Verrucomicrobiae bacterium]